jgi:hypothetical protein
MNVHDEMSDSEVLRAAPEFLSRISVAGPPDAGAITARGRARRNRRLASGAGLSVAAAATALALSLTGLGPSQATAPGSVRTMSFTLVSHHNGTATPTIKPPHTAAAVTLINGDRLGVRTSAVGGPQVAVRKAGGADSLLSLRLGGTAYEIPAVALPYIGRGLDPSLFSLASLQREEKSGRLPVTVSYAAGRPRLPGVTFTRSGGGSASGYLTAASAKVFGAALMRQFEADHARASYGQDGLFAGGVGISLAGVPATSTPVRPAYRMHTLTVAGRNMKGRPDTGDAIILINAANAAIFGAFADGFSFFYKGVAKFSVPAGTYWAIGDFISGNFTAERLAVLPQFTVKNASTVHVNERAASSEVTVQTPRPTVMSQDTVEIIRSGLHGTTDAVSWTDSGRSTFVSPTTVKPTLGGLREYTSATLTAPPETTGTPYTYNADFQAPDGIIPQQHFVLSPADLATVQENFYQDVKSQGGWILSGGFAKQLAVGSFTEVVPFSLPGQQIQYFTAGPDVAWQAGYVAYYNEFAGGQTDAWHTLAAGQQATENWNAYPLHPQPDVQALTGALAAQDPQYPSAFRVGNKLSLFEMPFSDNSSGHTGAGFFGVPGSVMIDSYDVYQDGTRIAYGDPANGIPAIPVSASPSTIRFALNADLVGAQYPLSPASSTVWTWKTQAEPTATVPDSWYCGFRVSHGAVSLIHRCAIQPLLTLDYQVQGLSPTGHTAPGTQAIDVSAGHLQQATSSAITGLTAAYSLNDGQSWQTASVTATGSGQFQLGFSAPAGTDVTLRVSATDAAGGSITETIVRAYGVSS